MSFPNIVKSTFVSFFTILRRQRASVAEPAVS